MKKQLAAAALVLSTLGGVATAAATTKPKATSHATYALTAKACRVGFAKKTETHKVKGHSKRYVACVWKVSDHAAIDPSYTQNPSNPLDVTFSYSATGDPLATGVLELFWGPSQSQTLACSMNVGGDVTGGTCEVVFPNYGPESITVEYLSGSTSATQTDTENIVDPNPVATSTTSTTSTTVATPTPTTAPSFPQGAY